ncbi:hypothetical protein B0H16DRAFT_1448617 [Mycena metata]|uniref:Uncharacterized protein n=1 Tax=Mycena metata TaxID=1033252 RepID=A0AAD7NWU3_9AGAR|nr:hypothetical protein B0H16DRAFT_1448617 [Mycena metata]
MFSVVNYSLDTRTPIFNFPSLLLMADLSIMPGQSAAAQLLARSHLQKKEGYWPEVTCAPIVLNVKTATHIASLAIYLKFILSSSSSLALSGKKTKFRTLEIQVSLVRGLFLVELNSNKLGEFRECSQQCNITAVESDVENQSSMCFSDKTGMLTQNMMEFQTWYGKGGAATCAGQVDTSLFNMLSGNLFDAGMGSAENFFATGAE